MRFSLVNHSCPLTAVEWTNLESTYCKNGEMYHCIPNQNGQLGQVCTPPIWIQPNFCPEFNTVAQKLDARPCDFQLGTCPFRTYLSNTAYKYSACIPTKEDKKTTEQFATTEAQTSVEMTQSSIFEVTSGVNIPAAIAILVLLLAVLVFTVLFGVFTYRKIIRRRHGKAANKEHGKDKHEGTDETGRLVIPSPCPEMQRHREDTTFYSSTKVAATGWKVLSHYGVLILVGLHGSGKTRLGLEMGYVAENTKGKHTVSKLVRGLGNLEQEIETNYHTCLFLDDCFENWNYTQQETTSTKNSELDRLTLIYENYIKKKVVSIILTVNLTTWNRFSGIFKASSVFAHHHIVVIEYDIVDRREIFQRHAAASGLVIAETSESSLPEDTNVTTKAGSDFIKVGNVKGKKEKDITENGDETYDYIITEGTKITSIAEKGMEEILKVETKGLGFPEACALFCNDKALWPTGAEFFLKPMKYLKRRLTGMLKSRDTFDKAHMCTLWYTLVNNGILEVNKINQNLLSEIGNLCQLDIFSADIIGKSSQHLSGSHLTEVCRGKFVFQHNVIEIAVLGALYEKNAELFFRLCPTRTLQRYVRTHKYKNAAYEMAMVVQSKDTATLAKRLADDGLRNDHSCIYMLDEEFKKYWDKAIKHRPAVAETPF